MPRSRQLTPMLRQYLEIKAEVGDAILLYRMGDFYEMFFEDAEVAAPVLEVVLTRRQKGTPSEAPMCGVPFHAVDGYVAKLLRAGHRVAICDQVEDPAKARGLVKRRVTRVITPGTLTDPELLEGKESNLLACCFWQGERGAGAFLDVSTGRFFARRWSTVEEGVEDLRLLGPREVLAGEELPEPLERWCEEQGACRSAVEAERWHRKGAAARVLERHLGVATLAGFGLEEDEPAVLAAAAALAYAQDTQRSDLRHVRRLELWRCDERMVVDSTTVANLELFRGLRGDARQGTLLGVLDHTVTAAGGRLIRDWIARPLKDVLAIERRHGAVEELLGDPLRRDELRRLLGSIGDPERLASRAVLGLLTPREAVALRETLITVPEILRQLAASSAPLLVEIAATEPVASLREELRRLLQQEPSTSLRDGGVIADGVDPELDECRSLARHSKEHILALEREERERTGISSLKIRYNKVFGYYLEVTRANRDLVPERYIRKQTLVNAERYVTPEIKELEERILAAEERQLELEAKHFTSLRAKVAAASEDLGTLGRALGALDALSSFAEVAARYAYVRPRMGELGGPIRIRDGRHPVVERQSGLDFVPNDTELDGVSSQIAVITGPNMGGKSTYLRQVALIVLLAQAGSFVPAAEAEIGVVDRLFTRVGASDDLARGESTFMVEMVETANILNGATEASLVILDEVGRGTATFDGLSLAWAVVEFLHEHRRPKTLFATHYHELTELAALLPGVVNLTLAVKEWQDQIVFLRRVVPGSADKSYGLHVARLAGLPADLVRRAGEILANLEAQEYDVRGKPRLAAGREAAAGEADQLSLFAPPTEMVAEILREVDLERLSPLAALNLLHALKGRLEG